jgi:sugar/nucleoside kinase (ribokinase family)
VPGTVQQVPGGVGRNIAEATARILGSFPSSSSSSSSPAAPASPAAVALVSVVGDDAAGAALRASCSALLDSSGVSTAPPGVRTPTVVAVLDPGGGELAACVADAATTEAHLPPAAVAREVGRRLGVGGSGGGGRTTTTGPAVVVLDGNLSPEALLAGARAVAAAARRHQQHASSPPVALFEPVSAPKAARGAAALPWLSHASPNAGELRALAAAVAVGRSRRRSMAADGGAPLLATSAATAASRERWVARAGGRRRSGDDGTTAPPPPPPDAVMQQLREALPDAVAVLGEGLGCLILTLGELGAALLTLHRRHPLPASPAPDAADPSSLVVLVRHVPAVPGVRAVSTSGAGDCLVAGFAAGLSCLVAGGADGDGDADAEVAALALGAAAAATSVASAQNVPGGGALDVARLAPLARGLMRQVGVATVAAGRPGVVQSRL